jgi:RimJ/RimL family protein N-acetyltransferase
VINYTNLIHLKGDLHKEKTYKWRNDAKVYFTCRQFTLLHPNEHLKWHENLPNDNFNKMFGVINEYGEDIGVCGFTNISWQARHSEISLYISPEHQKKGYGLATLYTLCRHGFKDFNFNKLWGECFNNNLPSFKIFKTIGFVASPGHIKHYFKNGEYINTTFMTLLQEDFDDQVYSRSIRQSPAESIDCT